jgi:hypothetical protein
MAKEIGYRFQLRALPQEPACQAMTQNVNSRMCQNVSQVGLAYHWLAK